MQPPATEAARSTRRALLSLGGRAAALTLAVPFAARGVGPVQVAAQAPRLSRFSDARPDGALPSPWEHRPLRKVPANRHRLVTDAGSTVLEISSHASASSLIHPLSPTAPAAARLRWRWRAQGRPPQGRIGEKAGDDYLGRIYLLFDYPMERVPAGQWLLLRAARALHDPALPAATLCYLMDPRAPAGTLLESPYTSRVRMIVVRDDAGSGRWWEESRDLEADFQRAFGAEYGAGMPPLQAVAIAADTDQGGGRVETRFGDLALD